MDNKEDCESRFRSENTSSSRKINNKFNISNTDLPQLKRNVYSNSKLKERKTPQKFSLKRTINQNNEDYQNSTTLYPWESREKSLKQRALISSKYKL